MISKAATVKSSFRFDLHCALASPALPSQTMGADANLETSPSPKRGKRRFEVNLNRKKPMKVVKVMKLHKPMKYIKPPKHVPYVPPKQQVDDKKQGQQKGTNIGLLFCQSSRK